MFADMSYGSGIQDRVADTVNVDVVISVMSALREVVTNQGGRVIKTIGDEVLCVFPEAQGAVLAAGDMQTRVTAVGKRDPVSTPNGLQLRVGLHYGVVIDEGDDVYGNTVNTAARILSLCKSSQTLVSEDVISLLSPELRRTTRFIDEVQLRGKTEWCRVHEVLTEISDATVVAGAPPPTARTEHSRCTLSHLGDTIEMSEARAIVQMGRARSADLCCVGGLISRDHARIEYQGKRFVLTDLSANGTYLWPDGDPAPMSIRREHFILKAGSGVIGLGKPPLRGRVDDIHYVVE